MPARSLSAGGTLRPMDPSGSDVRPLAASAFRRRSILVGTWLAGSAWEGWAIYTAFMARSENPSTEVAVALARAWALNWVSMATHFAAGLTNTRSIKVAVLE